jgi:hypothetical protein
MGVWDTTKKVGGTIYGGVKKVGKGLYDAFLGSAGTYTPASAESVYWGGNPFAQQARVDEYGRNLYEGYDASRRFEDAGMGARGLELSVYDRYQQMADGRGPSVAREMAKQGADVAQQQALQLAAGARGGGGNQLLAMRQAQQTGALAQQRAMATSAQLGQQEQLSAMGAMGDLASRVRAGDAQAQELAAARGAAFLGARQGVEGAAFQGEQARALANQEAENMAKQEALRSKREQQQNRRQIAQNAASLAAKGAMAYATGGASLAAGGV